MRTKAIVAIVQIAVASFTAFSLASEVTRESSLMADGAEQISFDTTIGGRKSTLKLIRFTADKFRMMVASNPQPKKRLYIADFALQFHAVAGCNGGYFNMTDFSPATLEIAQGVSTGKLGSSGSSGGIFGVKAGVPFIADEKGFNLSPDVTDLVQCGPLLMADGKVFSDPGKATAPRTFVMTDGKGQWAIGVTTSLTLTELASTLTSPGLIPDFVVATAMNLDGGPSTGLWWQDKNGQPHNQRERWSVRNMLLVVPK